MIMKPEFKLKEVVIRELKEDSDLNLGSNKEQKAEVVYVGERQEVYKAGDIVLYNQIAPHVKTKYFGEELSILSDERLIICKLV